uniref:VWA domain-containing protein n=1 Tax=Acidobacterium capsulatum TaxID=33075 RepID=A0A7V4XQY5_9BACT
MLLPLALQAQQAHTPAPYTLHEQVREVLLDVTVTDAHGHPVTGLPESDFHISDDGHPQKIDTFVEHQGPDMAPFAPKPVAGDSSNAFLAHPPPALNVLLIDTTTMTTFDQMDLNQRLIHFVHQLPAGQSLAIFARLGPIIVQLQGLTANHNLLLAAIHKAIPRFRPQDYARETDFDALKQMAFYLRQYPGRKNLLWFNGGSNLFLFPHPDIGTLPDLEKMRPIFDNLESERIAVYPIDVRGIRSVLRSNNQQQIQLMRKQAGRTGGRAIVNSNDLASQTLQIVKNSGSFYTLTYKPDDIRRDKHWHAIHIKLPGHYTLHYRQGYFDDGHLDGNHTASSSSLKLAANGGPLASPDEHSQPILFAARAIPGKLALQTDPVQGGDAPKNRPKHGEQAYTVHFALPASAFHLHRIDAHHASIQLGAAILAFNQYSDPVSHRVQQSTLTINTDPLRKLPDARFPFDELIYLPKGDDYLYLAVWDTTTGRMGTLNIPLKVTRH